MAGTLIFDMKCQLRYSSYGGRLLYVGDSKQDPRLAGQDISFDIKRLCCKLKKSADAQPQQAGSEDPSRSAPIAIASPTLRYRLQGSLIVDELTKDICYLILIQAEAEEQKGPAQLDLTYYQSTYRLTQRESQILELLSKGASYKEIAYTLMISEHTVRDHIQNIRFKLNADGKCGILARLIENAAVTLQPAALSSAPATVQEAALPPVSAKSHVSRLESRYAAVGNTIVAAVSHIPETPKRLDTVVVPNTHTPNARTGRIAQSPTGGSLRLNGKREIQARGKPV